MGACSSKAKTRVHRKLKNVPILHLRENVLYKKRKESSNDPSNASSYQGQGGSISNRI